jgi:hypothetical protein
MKNYKKAIIIFIDLLIILMVLTLILYIISLINSRTNKYVVYIAIPAAVLLAYSFIMLTDVINNSSKHRKMIIRKRRRRKVRYTEEGLIIKKRVAI